MAEFGLHAPQDVSVVGFDDIAMSQIHNLTTMHVPTALIGRTAVRMLSDALVVNDLNNCKVLVGGTLVERSGCRPAE